MAQTFGVVHILVPGEATKYRLSEQPGQCVPTILAGACVGQNITCHRGQAECVVEFAIGQQSGIGRHHRAAKLKHQTAIEIQPKSIRFRFTRWFRHRRPRSIQDKLLIAISESRTPRRNSAGECGLNLHPPCTEVLNPAQSSPPSAGFSFLPREHTYAVSPIQRLRTAPMMPASAIIVSTARNPPSAEAVAPPATPALPPRKVMALTMPEPCPACSCESADSASRGARA